MGRTQRALTSLVAAIPAGFLTYLLVQVFLSGADKLTTITMVIVGVTLACAALVTLMPFGLLIFGGAKKIGADAKPKPGAAAVDADDDAEAVEEIEEADSEETSAFEDDESDGDILADSDAEVTGPASSLDEIESIDFDDEEEEPAPKKRKK